MSAQLQPHFGLAAGVPVTDTLISSESSSSSSASSSFNNYNSKTKRLLIGPAFRLDLIKGLGLEFDAIYQRVDYDATNRSTQASTPPFSSYSFQQTTANRWQFPLLIQYAHALPLSKARAFVEFGPSISHIGGGQSTVYSTSTTPSSPTASSTTTNVSSYTGQGSTQAGVTAGAGIDITMFHLHLRPQFRYSHWFQTTAAGGSQITVPTLAVVTGNFLVGSPYISGSAFRTQSNEASFLLDLLF